MRQIKKIKNEKINLKQLQPLIVSLMITDKCTLHDING